MYPKVPYHDKQKKTTEEIHTFPPQHQDVQPGTEAFMEPVPIFDNPAYKGSDKLKDKVVLITGGDSGIGRATSIAFAKEGAKLVIVYYNEHEDAKKTKEYVEKYGGMCTLIDGDLKEESFCNSIVKQTIDTYGKLDVLVLNQAVQYPQNSILDISAEQLDLTFRTNIYPMFYVTKAALPHLQAGSSIVLTSSITAYQGNVTLIDYSATKGAVTTFTRSLSQSLASQEIRVNAVAPGPIWTPLIPSSFPAEHVSTFGADTPMKRAGQPFELAPAYVYLASDDSRYVSGQVIHVNGGTITES
ncbi:SDR family oxidoreductase [Brevibacillus daliensis]|uniref:SDR family oxidoreductase n=1 Tax=Brevibacillus daliensis TaxID=2892995 RepID=UPI001E43CC44|nr:SDR family oxidoreductase [Brevibacillus daliensis]